MATSKNEKDRLIYVNWSTDARKEGGINIVIVMNNMATAIVTMNGTRT